MASKVSICNSALIKLGANTITSLTEDSEEARKCNAIFEHVLDTLLQMHPWNFATYRATLAQLSETPEYRYQYYFQLPTSPYCLQVLEVYNKPEYKIEGRKLATDEDVVQIKYIGRVTDMNQLSPAFRECLAFYIARDLSDNMTGSGRQKNDYNSLFERYFKLAKLRDAQEDTPDDVENGSWIDCRIAGKSYLNS
jgi:hypothetical protein